LEREERKKERPQKQRDDERARERDDMCVCGVARDTKKSPHVRTATNESEEELVLGEYFSLPPHFLNPKP
jgi:hypothetical protein